MEQPWLSRQPGITRDVTARSPTAWRSTANASRPPSTAQRTANVLTATITMWELHQSQFSVLAQSRAMQVIIPKLEHLPLLQFIIISILEGFKHLRFDPDKQTSFAKLRHCSLHTINSIEAQLLITHTQESLLNFSLGCYSLPWVRKLAAPFKGGQPTMAKRSHTMSPSLALP